MWLQIVTLGKKLLDKYKEKMNKNSKKDTLSLFFVMLKIFVMCFIPIFNIILFCSIMFYGDQFEELTTQKVEEELCSYETN
jgi:hypothetical protein